MSETVTAKVRGLFLQANDVSEAPDGALERADNAVISRDSILEPRRGLERLGATGAIRFVGRYFVWDGDHLFSTSTGLTFTDLGAYDYPRSASTMPEAAHFPFAHGPDGALYFSSDPGFAYRAIDWPVTAIETAGSPPGLDMELALSSGAGTALETDGQVAYRVVWVRLVATLTGGERRIPGPPSWRATIANSSGGPKNVNLVITVPPGVAATTHRLQVYRSPKSATVGTTPSDELQLVIDQAAPASGATVAVTDTIPDALLGAALYTNESQEGALAANWAPPQAADLCLYRGSMIYAGLAMAPETNVAIIATGTGAVDIGTTIRLGVATFTGAAAENIAAREFKVFTGGSPAADIAATAASLIRVWNRTAGEKYIAISTDADDGLPGHIRFLRIAADSWYTVTTTAPGTALQVRYQNDAERYRPNALSFSKAQIPEAVPLGNYATVGGPEGILRVIATRDAVIIFTNGGGVWRLSGETPETFRVDPLDLETQLVAPRTAVLLDNRVFCLSRQGVVAVSNEGTQLVSRDIEPVIFPVVRGQETTPADRAYPFAVAYPSAHKYILWLPPASDAPAADGADDPPTPPAAFALPGSPPPGSPAAPSASDPIDPSPGDTGGGPPPPPPPPPPPDEGGTGGVGGFFLVASYTGLHEISADDGATFADLVPLGDFVDPAGYPNGWGSSAVLSDGSVVLYGVWDDEAAYLSGPDAGSTFTKSTPLADFHLPYAAVGPSDAIGLFGNDDAGDLVFELSTDKGVTWTRTTVVTRVGGDPAPHQKGLAWTGTSWVVAWDIGTSAGDSRAHIATSADGLAFVEVAQPLNDGLSPTTSTYVDEVAVNAVAAGTNGRAIVWGFRRNHVQTDGLWDYGTAYEPRVAYSDDGGVTWTAGTTDTLGTSASYHSPEVARWLGGSTFASVGTGPVDGEHAFALSTDGGATWATKTMPAGEDSNDWTALAASPTSLVACRGGRTAWRSTDLGDTWTLVFGDGVAYYAVNDALYLPAAAAPPGEDPFGVTKLYATAEGGREWFLPDAADLNADPVFVPEARDIEVVSAPSPTVYATDGNDRYGEIRMNVRSPAGAAWWRNVEVTAYYRYTAVRTTLSDQWPHWAFEVRNETHTADPALKSAVNDGHMPPEGTVTWPWWDSFSPSDAVSGPARGSSYHGLIYAQHGTDPTLACCEKELTHTEGYCGPRGKLTADYPAGIPPAIGTWFGVKFVTRNNVAGTAVKLEVWLDADATNEWVKITEYTDENGAGHDWLTGNTNLNGCGPSSTYAYALNQLVTWAGPWVCFRADNMRMEFQKLSVREVAPW